MNEGRRFEPLVAPGAPLAADGRERYSRSLSLPGFGPDAQRRLAAARVLVVGAGGLGSAVIPALAAAGIGTLGIVDGDSVELSNLPRQVVHTPADVGDGKVASAARTVAALGAGTDVVGFGVSLSAENALATFAGFDLVLDGSDNFPTRYLVNDAAILAGIPVVWGAVHQFGGQAGVSWAARGPHYRDLFPVPPEPGSVPSCAEAGALPSVCAVIGGIMVSETIKLITGVGHPLVGRVTCYDSLGGGFREIAYSGDPLAEAVTGLVDYAVFCGLQPARAPGTTAATSITTTQLQARLARGEPLRLVDVREPWEAEIAAIAGAALIPLAEIGDDPKSHAAALAGVPVVIVCHHGPRAERARTMLAGAGLGDITVLAGGIDAWAREIDPALARY
ncbi:ThiF family adenylyltransferase [Glaciibacter sp. 2TAF33]|uniref:ThiF family adenylyltransferase n=1 Tax=Glaciibacter sp. 2TAF33 TaxID=3233015 RepID=UPI003F932491